MMATDGGRQRRLLVVDDSRLIVEMVRDFFGSRGYAVEAARGAEPALETLRDWKPDVIVSDILMPGMDGWSLFERVRGDDARADVPFVFLTTESGLPERLRGLRGGADDYVTKPFAVEELHARVERIVKRRDALRRHGSDDDPVLAGAVEQLSISDLVQILSLNGKDGVILLRRGADTGRIVFRSGRIVHATCGEVDGTKALYRMLGWSAATFRLEPCRGEVEDPTVRDSTTRVLMDGLVSLDEWRRWSRRLPPEGSGVELAPDADERLEDRDVTPAELEVVGNVRRGAGVRQVLDRSPLPDAEVAEALCTLLTNGVLRTRE